MVNIWIHYLLQLTWSLFFNLLELMTSILWFLLWKWLPPWFMPPPTIPCGKLFRSAWEGLWLFYSLLWYWAGSAMLFAGEACPGPAIAPAPWELTMYILVRSLPPFMLLLSNISWYWYFLFWPPSGATGVML